MLVSQSLGFVVCVVLALALGEPFPDATGLVWAAAAGAAGICGIAGFYAALSRGTVISVRLMDRSPCAGVAAKVSVRRIVRITSLVNSAPDFIEHHLVTNGCSELFGEVFAEKGAHARSAYGVAQLPLGACVEIELIAQAAE